jgi:hypothetical protein
MLGGGIPAIVTVQQYFAKLAVTAVDFANAGSGFVQPRGGEEIMRGDDQEPPGSIRNNLSSPPGLPIFRNIMQCTTALDRVGPKSNVPTHQSKITRTADIGKK